MSASDRLRALADGALEATVVGSFSRIGFAARRALFHWDSEPAPDLSGRTVLITGPTSGLGLATAEAVAARGATVWLAGRDQGRVESARRTIIDRKPGATIHTAVADLAVLDDVRKLASTVRASSARLDVLVHNAGALTHYLRHTVDGIELTAQVHVVAPFLLTAELLPLLRAGRDARVITVSSGGMYAHGLDIELLESPREPFDGVRAYANAKRAQVVLNGLWASSIDAGGVAFHAMHPGWADTPGVRASLPRFRSLTRPILRTPAQGADTTVWLVSSAHALDSNGGFWHDRRPRHVAPVPGTSTSAHDAQRLWKWCADRAGIGALGVPS